MLKKKYTQKEYELVNNLKQLNRDAVVIKVEVIDTSKVEGNLIYECTYLDGNTKKIIPIIAYDVTQALAKLSQFTQAGIPEQVLKYMLGNERYT